MNEGALKGLVEKAKLAVPDKEDWQVYFLGFSKSGFTRQAEEFAQAIAKARPAGSRWAIAGCLLVDLPRLDRDLAEWAS